MRDEEIKKKLIEWLNEPFNEPQREWIEALRTFKTIDETLLGAKYFLFDTHNNYKLLHKTIGELNVTLPVKKNSFRYYSKAAIFILLIGIPVFLLLTTKSNKFEIIEEGLPVFMTSKTGNSDAFMNAYRMGEYTKTIDIGKHLPLTDTLNFYMGCSYLYSRDNENAITHLSKINKASEFYCNALYQKAYACANKKNNEQAITLLKEVLNKGCTNYVEKAEGFLKELTK